MRKYMENHSKSMIWYGYTHLLWERESLRSFTVLGKVLTELLRSYQTPLTESSSFRGARGQLYTLID